MTVPTEDRIAGCLNGIATGDAIGKQTESLSQENVRRWYPMGVRGFEGAPGTVIPRYARSLDPQNVNRNSKHEWRIGETTDDTERTIAVARALIADRAVSHVSIGREMLRCTKCVHPGVKSLWEFHQAADPARVARSHDGCGAAVRVGPVGILYSSARMDEIVSGAYEASISTHGGSLAIAAAAATAAAVSTAIDGGSSLDVLQSAFRAAGQAENRRPGSSTPAFAEAVRHVHDTLAHLPVLRPADVASRCFPDSPLTIVPLALALATLLTSAEDAVLLAANIGGDSDSVASIAGGILGAMYPDTVNRHWSGVVESINDHDLEALATELTRLRH